MANIEKPNDQVARSHILEAIDKATALIPASDSEFSVLERYGGGWKERMAVVREQLLVVRELMQKK